MNFKNQISRGSAFVLALTAIVITISCAKDPVAPEEEFTFAGDYTGFWNTTITNNQFNNGIADQVSARFEEADENLFVGTFYWSQNWNSCCGAVHDGEISFQVQGDSLKNLLYNQDFRCSGTFTGLGAINDEGKLAFKISGPDCFGSHVGTLLLTKQ